MGEKIVMANNNFKPFGIGNGANVTNQADYEALAALLSGFTAGKASSAQVNKALRQGTVMASVLAQFIANTTALDVLDNGDTATLLTNFLAALKKNSAGSFLQTSNNLSEIATAGTAAQTAARTNITAAALAGSSSQQFSVAAATNAASAVRLDQFAATLNTPGVIKFPGGFTLMWTQGTTDATGAANVTLPASFSTACFGALAIERNPYAWGAGITSVWAVQYSALSKSAVQALARQVSGGTVSAISGIGCMILAWGY